MPDKISYQGINCVIGVLGIFIQILKICHSRYFTHQRVEYEIGSCFIYFEENRVFGNHIPRERSLSGIWFPKTLLPEKDMKLLSPIPRVYVWIIWYTPHYFSLQWCNNSELCNFRSKVYEKISYFTVMMPNQWNMDLKTTVSNILLRMKVFWTKFTSEIWKT